MKHPKDWTRQELHAHLQHAADLEFWTIPLYLTALYSVNGLRGLKPEQYPEAAKLVQSVVIQEMLHLEIVCNISHAMGYTPAFHVPQYDEQKGIPFIHPSKAYLPDVLQDYSVKPRALCRDALKLFCAVELPHPRSNTDWEQLHEYRTIADLYAALHDAIAHQWEKYYVGKAANTKQKNSFKEYQPVSGKHHGFSQVVDSKATALKAIAAIVEQGEGADAAKVPAEYRPPEEQEGKAFDPGWFRGDLSHYQKFSLLLHKPHLLPEVYTEHPSHDAALAQATLDTAFAAFLQQLQGGFATDGDALPDSFWNAMFALSGAVMGVWEAGACPKFNGPHA